MTLSASPRVCRAFVRSLLDLRRYAACGIHPLETYLLLMQIFARADIPKFRVLENPESVPKSTILIDQDVAYYRDDKADSPTKVSTLRFPLSWRHIPVECALYPRQFISKSG